MREIELKFKVEDIENVVSFLEKNNCKISSIIYQNDTIYVKDLDKVKSIEDSIWLRVKKLTK